MLLFARSTGSASAMLRSVTVFQGGAQSSSSSAPMKNRACRIHIHSMMAAPTAVSASQQLRLCRSEVVSSSSSSLARWQVRCSASVSAPRTATTMGSSIRIGNKLHGSSSMQHPPLFATTTRSSHVAVLASQQQQQPSSFPRLGYHLPRLMLLPQQQQQQLGILSHFSTEGGNSSSSSRSSKFPQIQPPPPPPNRLAQGAGLLGAASLLFGKTKYVLAALKLTKLASLGSMVVSVGAYSMVFGLPYAAGMVGLIFVHELGHLGVMLQRGMPFSPMVFIPFMGAVIATKEQPRDAWEDALIAAGGPVAGSLAAGAVAVMAHGTDSQLLYALADFGFMINLFNLLPIGSMDGGRWVGALSKYVGVAGSGLGGYIAYSGAVSNPLFYLIWLAGTYETFQRFYNPLHLPPNFYKISMGQRAVLTGGYFGLVVALLAAMAVNQRNKKSPEVIVREQGGEPMWDTSSYE